MFHTLIAEDNVGFRHTLRDILVRRFPFMAVEEAGDGDQAIAQGMVRHHDLVFLDIKMPGANGLEVTRIIRSGDRDAVICIVTSHDLPEYREAARACGADHFIVKGESTEATIASLVENVVATRLKALIVEDDAPFRRLLHALLTRQHPDAIVAEADDVPRGLEDAARLDPDLLLLDLRLPTGSGLDLAAALKARSRVPVIVIVTAFDLPEYREAAIRCGIRHYLTKDRDIADELRRVVDGILADNPRLLH